MAAAVVRVFVVGLAGRGAGAGGRSWGGTGTGAGARPGGWAGCGGASGVTGLLRDTANVLATAEHNVALHTPLGTPRVLHFPVVLAAHGTVAHGQHTVVQFCTAFLGVHHTGLVHLENPFVSLDSDGHWLLGHSGFQGVLVL